MPQLDSSATPATADSAATPPPYACSHCSACGYNNFPPAEVCPNCWSTSTSQQDLSPNGVLYSFSTTGGGDAVRYVGYVDLPENVRVFGLLNMGDRPVCGLDVSLASVRAPGDGPCFTFDIAANQEASP